MSLPAPAHRKPALAAAVIFASLAGLIARLAIAPLGAADLLGIAACAAAAGGFAVLAFVSRPGVAAAPVLRDEAVEEIAARLEARLASTVSLSVASALSAAEEKQRVAQHTAIAATTPPRLHDADSVSAPASGAKSRLGRGLLGLMHAPSALASAAKSAGTTPSVSAPAHESSAGGDASDSERAAA